MAFLCASTMFLTSCGDDDDDLPAKPSITLTEVGHDNAKHCHPGHDLHLEADVVAEGLIQRIDVEIHEENGGSFKIEKSYTDGNTSAYATPSSTSISTFQPRLLWANITFILP